MTWSVGFNQNPAGGEKVIPLGQNRMRPYLYGIRSERIYTVVQTRVALHYSLGIHRKHRLDVVTEFLILVHNSFLLTQLVVAGLEHPPSTDDY